MAFSEENLNLANKLYDNGNGLSLTKVAKQFNLTTGGLSKAFKRAGISIKKNDDHVKYWIPERLIDMVKYGFTEPEIASMTSMSRKTVSAKLVAIYEYKPEIEDIVHTNGIAANIAKKSLDLDSKIKELIDTEARSDESIAISLDCHPSTVKRSRKRLGISYTMSEVHARDDYKKHREELYKNEDYLASLAKSNLATWSDSKLVSNHSDIMTAKWNDQDYRSKQESGWDEDARQQQSSKQVALWSDKEFRAKFVEDRGSISSMSKLMLEWSDKNDVDVSLITRGSKYKAWWKCLNGHEWQANVKDRCRLDRPSGCPNCAGLSSRDEEYIYDFVKQYRPDVLSRQKGLLVNKNLEIDIYIPSLKLGIEMCGLYSHREGAGRSSSYHRDKYSQARDAGISLLTIFDSELHNHTKAVEGYLLSKLGVVQNEIGARECTIVNVSDQDAESFLNTYHVQGYISAKRNYGLEHNGILVALMSFNPHRKTGKNGVYELSRYCLQNNLSIHGGAERLLKKFIKDIKPIKIISFSDNRWSNGQVYKKLGFKFDGPVKKECYYLKVGKMELIPKIRIKKKDIANNGETKYQAMLRLGYDRIWDCGKMRWVYDIQ